MTNVFENIPVEKKRSQNEAGFWKLLKSHMPPGAHYQRIETGGTGLGTPDLNVCDDGFEFWIELKVCAGLKIGLRPEQISWHLKRHEAGGASFILVRRQAEGPRIGKIDKIFLYNGWKAVWLNTDGLKHPPLLELSAPFDWGKLWRTINSCCIT